MRTPTKQAKTETTLKFADAPGEFMMLSKYLLKIDHSYQRDHLRKTRVESISREWSWRAFGVLMVARRNDKFYWVFDGQHRLAAANKRPDILELPCMVFATAGAVEEAGDFLRSADRGGIRAIDAFKAKLAQQVPSALGVQEMVTRAGYRIASGSNRGTVSCVGNLEQAWISNPKSCEVAWDICVRLCAGEVVDYQTFDGIFAVERFLARMGQSLARPPHSRKMNRLTLAAVKHEMAKSVMFHGSGSRARGQGLIQLLNKGCRTKGIPSLMTSEEDA